MYSSLYDHFSKYVHLTDGEFAHCLRFFKHKRFRKRQYILQEGQLPCSIYLLTGLVRLFEVNESGQEQILIFSQAQDWISGGDDVTEDATMTYNIDCIEDTEVLLLNCSQKELLIQSLPKMCRFFRYQLQEDYERLLKRIGTQLGKSAYEQYYQFMDQHPEIEQKVPNHFIASYLGITPQSLSRIRGARHFAAMPTGLP
jgi:CRP-like cAMP-binding protein